MSRGPLDLVVVQFPGDVPGARLAKDIARLVEQDTIRVIDLAFVRKDADGTVSTFEISAQEGHPDFEALDAVVQAVDGLIAEDDLAAVAAEMPAGCTAVALLWENVWAAQLRRTVTDAGGEIVFTERIPAAVVEVLARN